ncbi:cytochrome P450 [Alisedimentitalea sp. MJ-SS2]|uniref:cytochrome P450 n=1 Tax=Aliisedimentitalea sp. MJ-SS2 TaxID=3049795 RepID=UPI002915314C|nr:cytochrome P450 [Alisedimentitalea sp. MJ-SS2]MDU8928646.1 cytochrome P450 [Alisedimentitalea sp. MJ-SS2]
MSNAPHYEIDPDTFWRDPYPDLKRMRTECPVAYVPQLGATLLTRRDDIFENEKKIEIFSSDQPEGLMTLLMGQNMMRKDGEAHMAERRAIFPTVSPKTVKQVWKGAFERLTAETLADIHPQGHADMVRDISRRIAGEALKVITGLTCISWQEMDRVSQGMIDGCANYRGDPEVEANCHDCTAAIDRYIDEMIPALTETPDTSLLSVHLQAGLSDAQTRANVKLAISGGQNEIRDVISGVVWTLLTHPDQLQMIDDGDASWLDAFEEYSRWMSPVGMSPRRVAQRYQLHGVTLEPEDRVFLMFGSGNRDETVFDRPELFDMTQNVAPSIAFGAGPHFCAGAWAARSLISDVALPMIFDRLPGLKLEGETEFGGWAFRGPLSMPVAWEV